MYERRQQALADKLTEASKKLSEATGRCYFPPSSSAPEFRNP
jgi:hypothetical protein